jgi:transcriptional regulator with XRE-family HTH domain
VSVESVPFGTELRRRRVDAGLSLTRLANLIHYSKGHLSKIETGQKPPTVDLARQCDATLGAGGSLAALVVSQPNSTGLSETVGNDEVWLMNLAVDGTSWFQPIDRRQAMGLGAASALAFGIGGRTTIPSGGRPVPLEIFRSLFDQIRQLGQTSSPGVVLPTLIAQIHTLRRIASEATADDRKRALVLCARYTEYAGWMAQELGNDRAALWLTDRAVEMAATGGDENLAAYALVRRALITLYREDAAQTIELARLAQTGPVPTRIRGLAAQREAQGHALAGDYDSCLRSLDRARELLGAADPDPTSPALGTANLADPVGVVRGWCLHDLGRPHEAAEILDREYQRIPVQALRARARYGARRALAHAAAGQVEVACAITEQLLDMADTVNSATIASDVRRLARTLSRFHAHRSVRALYPRLTASLHNLAG